MLPREERLALDSQRSIIHSYYEEDHRGAAATVATVGWCGSSITSSEASDVPSSATLSSLSASGAVIRR